MSITFTRTAGALIAGAMQDMRVLALGEAPTADEYTYGVAQLNLMLKSMGSEGITPWAHEEATVTFVAGTATMTLTPRPIQVFDVSLTTTGYSRPLAAWEAGEYYRLPNRTQEGSPMAFLVQELVDSVTMTLWPVPSEDTDIAYRYMRVVEDVADENSVLDVPQSWLEGLQAMLAVRLTAFGDIPQDALGKASAFYQRLSDQSRPDSYVFESGL